MDLTIVIPAYNAESTLQMQLDALLGQSWDHEWEIIVVDNASTDQTAAIVSANASIHPRLRLISEGTAGACHARNAGIVAAHGRAVALCDQDDIVGSRWVAAMGSALVDHELVTGPEELTRLNPKWIIASRGQARATTVPTFHGIFPFPNGNNVGFHKALVDRVGPFDQRFYGADDAEFGLRAWLAGVDVRYEPEAIVHYAYRTTARELWRQGLGYGRARPALVRQLLDADQPRPPRFAGWKSWAWLVVNSPRVVTAEGRATLAWVAGNRLGHVVGSAEHRTILI